MRNLTLTGAAYSGFSGGNPCTTALGVPLGIPIQAIGLNFTMVAAGGPADLRVAPWGTAPASSVMNSTGPTVANAAVEEVQFNGSNGYGISVKSGGAPFHLLVDVLGYYTDSINSPISVLGVSNTDNIGVIAYSSGNDGIIGGSSSTLSGAAGVWGTGTNGAYGVYGSSDTARGVFGDSTGGRGVYGHSAGEAGVYGTTDVTDNSAAGVSGHGDSGAYGVYGHSSTNHGVHGVTTASGLSSDGAGVFGVDGSGATGLTGLGSSGVRGESNSFANGVVGVGGFGGSGVVGVETTAGGAMGTAGYLASGLYGVYSHGDFGGDGAKYFVEPHPTDPTKEIRYVCLEGPESGTYFRGHGKIANGLAVIEVPESFRFVTDPDDLTVVATPVDDFASLAVASKSLDRIVLRGTRDVRFDFIVNGVRKAFKDHQAISENRDFIPKGPKDPFFWTFPEESRRRLVATGIYKADGTVNIETAHRLGWDKNPSWAKDSHHE